MAGNFPGEGAAELSPDDGRLPPRGAGRGPGFLPRPAGPATCPPGLGDRGRESTAQALTPADWKHFSAPPPHPNTQAHRSWPRVPPPQTASRPHRASAGRVSGTGRGSPHWGGTVVFRDPPACLCLGALLPEQWARGQQREAAPRSPRQQGQGPEPRLCPLGFQLQVPAGGGGGTAGESRRCLDHCLLDKRAPALRPQFPHLHSQAHGLSGCELPPPQESPPLFEPRPSPGGPGPPFHRQGRWL